jgi:hypothetical protein
MAIASFASPLSTPAIRLLIRSGLEAAVEVPLVVVVARPVVAEGAAAVGLVVAERAELAVVAAVVAPVAEPAVLVLGAVKVALEVRAVEKVAPVVLAVPRAVVEAEVETRMLRTPTITTIR